MSLRQRAEPHLKPDFRFIPDNRIPVSDFSPFAGTYGFVVSAQVLRVLQRVGQQRQTELSGVHDRALYDKSLQRSIWCSSG